MVREMTKRKRVRGKTTELPLQLHKLLARMAERDRQTIVDIITLSVQREEVRRRAEHDLLKTCEEVFP